MDEGLQPGQTYQYTAQLITPTPPVWYDNNYTSQVQVRTMDTTSHNFTWQTFTFGDGTGSSCLYDVAIINAYISLCSWGDISGLQQRLPDIQRSEMEWTREGVDENTSKTNL